MFQRVAVDQLQLASGLAGAKDLFGMVSECDDIHYGAGRQTTRKLLFPFDEDRLDIGEDESPKCMEAEIFSTPRRMIGRWHSPVNHSPVNGAAPPAPGAAEPSSILVRNDVDAAVGPSSDTRVRYPIRFRRWATKAANGCPFSCCASS